MSSLDVVKDETLRRRSSLQAFLARPTDGLFPWAQFRGWILGMEEIEQLDNQEQQRYQGSLRRNHVIESI